MLDGVDLRRVHNGLPVGLCQPQVKGGDGFTAHPILPGDIEPRLQTDVVNGKAGDFFHDRYLVSIVFPHPTIARRKMQEDPKETCKLPPDLCQFGLHFYSRDDRILLDHSIKGHFCPNEVSGDYTIR